MITLENIKGEYSKIKQSDLPETLKRKEFDFVTENIDLYNDDETIKEFIDAFIAALNDFVFASELGKSIDYKINGNEFIVKNLKDFFAENEIENKFINNGVLWEMFGDNYIFDLKNKLHRKLIENELLIKLSDNKKTGIVKPKPINKRNGAKVSKPGNPVLKPTPKTDKKPTPKKNKQNPDKKPVKIKSPTTPTAKPKPKKDDSRKIIESYSDDVRLIRRFNAAIGKERQRRSILNIYRDFERRAVERKIKAESPYSGTIKEIQIRLKKAIDFIDNNNFDKIKIEAAKGSESFYKKIADISKSTGLRTSVGLLKRFIGIEGEIKPDIQKVGRLLSAFESALQKGKVCEIDLYWKEVNEAKKEMQAYIKGQTDRIKLSPQSLNGLGGIGLGKPKAAPKEKGSGLIKKLFKDFGISNKLSGISQPEIIRYDVELPKEPVVVPTVSAAKNKKQLTVSVNQNAKQSSLFSRITDDFSDSSIEKIQLPGDLGKFLGYVERYEYSILLRGDKGAGKTRLLYQLMNTFALAGFTVGSFSLEIGRNSNLVRDMRNTYLHPTIASNISIADKTPNGIKDIEQAAGQFDVVCIDSWGKIGKTQPDDFDKLRKKHPKTMFIIIFQSTTNGTARGGSMPEYDAGVVVQVNSGGYAVCEKNRYNGEDLTYLVFDQKLETQEAEK